MEQKKRLDLYDVFELLQKDCGFSIEEIGKLYVAAYSSVSIFNCPAHYPAISSEDAERGIKKRFQISIRDFFLNVKNSYRIDGVPKKDIIAKSEVQSPRSFEPNNTTIECVVSEILRMNETGRYAKIGEAVIAGSKRYLSRKPAASKELPYKYYLEYDLILKQLKTVA